MQIDYIKELLNLKDDNLNILNISTIKEYKYIDLMYHIKPHKCPKCDNITKYVHDYRIRTIKHGFINGYFIILKYKRRRYICKKCNNKFPEDNSFVQKHHKISNINEFLILHKLKYNHSFKDIASSLNISSNTVIRVMDKHIDNNKFDLPEVLSFDEFIKSNKGKGKYAFNIVDPVNKKILDIIDDRRSYNLNNYFSNISFKQRIKVKYIVMDLWYPYRSIVKRYFPNATIIADKFHYLRYIFWAFNDIRIKTMNKYKKSSLEYKVLKKYWKILIKAPNNLTDDYKYNKLFNNYMSETSINDFASNINEEMEEAMKVKDFFFDKVNNIKDTEVNQFYDKFLNMLNECKKRRKIQKFSFYLVANFY